MSHKQHLVAGTDIALVEIPACLSSVGSCCHLRRRAAVRLVGRLNEPPCTDLVTSASFSRAKCLVSGLLFLTSENPDQHPAASQQASRQHLCSFAPALYVKYNSLSQEIKTCYLLYFYIQREMGHTGPLVVKVMLHDLQLFPLSSNIF